VWGSLITFWCHSHNPFHNIQPHNVLPGNVIILTTIITLITTKFQFTVRLFPDGHIKCLAFIIDAPSDVTKINSRMLNFNWCFITKTIVTAVWTTVQPFQLDTVTYGDLVLSADAVRHTEIHSQRLICCKPIDRMRVELSFNFRRLPVYRFRSINNTGRPMCNQYTDETSTRFSRIKPMHKAERFV